MRTLEFAFGHRPTQKGGFCFSCWLVFPFFFYFYHSRNKAEREATFALAGRENQGK